MSARVLFALRIRPSDDRYRCFVSFRSHVRARCDAQFERGAGDCPIRYPWVRYGVATALGIAAGDLLFVVLAITGLVAAVEVMGAFFTVLRYCAAAYLIWVGVGLIRHRDQPDKPGGLHGAGGMGASFAAGIVLTLGGY